jgi:translocator protein
MVQAVSERIAVPPDRRGQVGRGQLALGAVVTGGAVLLAARLAQAYSPAPTNPDVRFYWKRLRKPDMQPPDWAFGIWGPLYAMLAVSGLRVWNARRGRERTRALLLWGGMQVLDVLWLWLGFGRRERGAMALESGTAIASAAAYVASARQVDRVASGLAVPHLAWLAFAALLSEELWRKNR